MSNSLDLSQFNKQSAKGIVILFSQNVYRMIRVFWVALIPIIAGKQPKKVQFIIIGGIALLVFILIKSILTYINYTFKISENHFILKHGILRKKKISIPFERIQNINFKQNFIQQIINVTQVDVETAGAKSIEISIKALKREKAEEIKALIFSTKKASNLEHVESKEEKPILKISFLGLLKESLTENHIRSFILFIVFLTSIYEQVKEVFTNFSLKNSTGIDIEETTNTTSGVVVIILLAVAGSFFISFFRIVFKHFDLTLYYKNQVLEITQGLFDKKNQVLKKEKVQSMVISTNPLKQFFGISSVYFKQVSNAKKAGKKALPTRIIGCEGKHIQAIKEFLFTNYSFSDKKNKPSSYYLFQLAIKNLYFFGIINLVIFFNNEFQLFYLNIALLPILGFLIYLKYQKSYFKLNNELLLIGSGKINTDTMYFAYYRLQSIELKQTIFQRKKNIFDVILYNATEKIKLPCVPKKDAQKLYNFLLFRTEISTKKWM